MSNGLFTVPPPVNEPVRSYAPGTPERDRLKAELGRQLADAVEVPLWIDGKPVRTGKTAPLAIPHDRSRTLGTFHQASAADVRAAIAAAQAAKPAWAALPWEERAAIFLRAATLLQGEFRDRLNAATMLGQSKTAHQAEIDAACELIDFFRFNVAFYARILADQPISPDGVWNRLDYRPLDGYVFAVTPFNFTSIAGNLPSAPALCGNTVIWKPASTAVHSGAVIMELFGRAGLPPGVINFLPGSGAQVGEPAIADADLAGVHFTGSTPVFKAMWKTIGNNIDRYRAYPRLCGETGGKDFVFAHPSADMETLAVALVRGAYEFQGQKCSAASRAYVPRSMWPKLEERMRAEIAKLKIGDVRDFRNFMGAVIDERAWTRLDGWRARLAKDPSARMICDAGWSRERGWFAGPTLVELTDPKHDVFQTELFGPILSLYVDDDGKPGGVDETLLLVNETSPYALTGAIFSEDRAALVHAATVLRQAAGNLYLNDKPTGAVVGQQPFGGARASGTNDKAGSAYNLLRWTSPRTVKETLVPPRAVGYPFLDEE